MTYFADLSRYAFGTPTTGDSRNVGWLDKGHTFPTEQPRPQLLDAVWEYCSILVVPTRGLHGCALCGLSNHTFARHGTKLLLGSGEIRVFSATGDAYAAPNMIYHYIFEHHYRPPREFLQALEDGPRAGSDEYLEKLTSLHVPWRENFPVSDDPETFRFVRTENGVDAERMTGQRKK